MVLRCLAGTVASTARTASAVLCLFLLLFAPLTPAAAQQPQQLRGVALVIGQADYARLPRLANPVNDARALDRLLSDLGFEVDAVLDGDRARLDRALRRFVEDAADADVALLYYSGHGVEAGGENFLVPVDADRARSIDAGALVPVSDLLRDLQRVVPVTIILLDACRDNPFPSGATVAGITAAPVPSSASGLAATKGGAPLRKQDESESVGAVIGFAAEPGRAALDGEPGGHSPYAAALLKHLAAAGYAFGDVMTMVTEEVYLATQTRQLLWTNASLRRLLYFGLEAEDKAGDEAAIRGERRSLLLTIAATPRDMRQLVETAAERNGVPLDTLYGMLKVLGVEAGGRADLNARLEEGAARLRAFMEERDLQTRTDPELIRLSDLAARAQAEGAVQLALRFRDQASARADAIDAAVDQAEANVRGRRMELAQTYRAHAETAILNFDFAAAARRYGDAFAQAERWDVPLAYELKVLQADALADHANFKGENASFERAIGAYREAMAIGRGSPNPRRDAAILGNMAIAMTQLGERSADMTWLDRAAATWRDVSKALPRKRYPEDWAYTRLNLGSLYNILGERTGDARYFDQALEALTGATKVMTREAYPFEWAGLQLNIGNAHHELGRRGGGLKSYREAVKAAEATLSVWTRERQPVDWASAQLNLGSSLSAVAVEEKDAAKLRRAIAAYRAAMEVATRERQPVNWASAMNNLGSAYLELAELENDPSRYADAAAAWRDARAVLTRETDALSHAATWYNEGRALLFQGRRETSAARLREAEAALAVAKQVLTEAGDRLQWARARSVEGEALAARGRLEGDRRALAEARAAFAEAARIYREMGLGETGQGFWQKQIAAIDRDLAGMK